jgi:tetratricopeptide (TPR) repeat protein
MGHVGLAIALRQLGQPGHPPSMVTFDTARRVQPSVHQAVFLRGQPCFGTLPNRGGKGKPIMAIRAGRSGVLVGALLLTALVPVAPGPQDRPTPALLEALDPTRQAAALCAGRPRAAAPTWILAAAAIAAPASDVGPVPLLTDLAAATFPVSAVSVEARRWFAQGLQLSYGFNHAGAVASFRMAQRLDPACALCWWGEALALGPNINAPMDGRDREAALAALERALALKGGASPLEQALIDALATRYSADEGADRAALDAAYAEAMLNVARRFPADEDVAVLAAEAVMDTSPWNYWLADGKPVGKSGEALRLLEAVMKRNPRHPQAAHLYIHMLEATDPKRAEAAADRLAAARPPSAAHLVHMPSHIWHLRGRYRDSIKANIAAARADEAWIRATDDRSLVRYGYHPHNVHFIVTSALMVGDFETVDTEVRRLQSLLDVETSAQIGWIQAIVAAPYQAMAQFAAPEALLAMPAPDARLPLAMAMHHFARAVAFAARRDRPAFDAEVAAMVALRQSPGAALLMEQAVPLPDLISIAEHVAQGRWAMATGAHAAAVGHFRAAAAVEATIPYMEPAYWHYPVNQSLGAALHLAGDQAGAIAAFRAALVQTPGNGWALFGLARSESAAGHKAEAVAAEAAFRRAWAGDVRWLKVERL